MSTAMDRLRTSTMGALGIAEIATADNQPTEQEQDNQRISGAVYSALGIGLGVAVVSMSLRETPTERLIRLYRADPALQVTVQPTAKGVGLGLSGTF